MSTTPKIHLIRRIDCLKRNWFVWEATKEWTGQDERMLHSSGTVQADWQGEAIAPETWEDEE